jgi:hypothetical protein
MTFGEVGNIEFSVPSLQIKEFNRESATGWYAGIFLFMCT